MASHQRLSSQEELARYQCHENSLEDEGYRQWLESFIDLVFQDYSLETTAKILDFGSGPTPSLAALMTQRGYAVELEDPYFAPGSPPGPFSLITSLEVFEHLAHPEQVVENLALRLEKGGRLCIGTSFHSFTKESLHQFESWSYRSDPTHIGFFTRKGLDHLMRCYGLQAHGGDGKRYACYRLSCPPERAMLG